MQLAPRFSLVDSHEVPLWETTRSNAFGCLRICARRISSVGSRQATFKVIPCGTRLFLLLTAEGNEPVCPPIRHVHPRTYSHYNGMAHLLSLLRREGQ